MWRLAVFGLALSVLLSPSCNKPKRVRATVSGEDDTGLRSVLHVADPKCAVQLLRGFHEVEGNAWRWTKGRFAVTLRPPYQGEKHGAYLVVRLSVAESTIQRLGSVTLSANVNGHPVPSETYDRTGDFLYRREVPASALQAEAVQVEFSLDKFLAAGQVEDRELGVIVSVIGFEARS
ncbi:MAG: hypothetical protein NZV14_01130 [Bryobacteraceae bacterium]|nr:hypothetical protein [Bryobacteraceae bacterium]MDW8376733.1 hypothetical protein [Bryobacterales bacterium]